MTELGGWLVRCIPRLRRYARALTGDAGRADDLVQDSLERAWGRRHLWRGEGDPQAWLFTIMHNVFANQARRYARTPPLLPLAEDAHSARDSDPAAAIEMHELGSAIAELPEPQREVILL
ncbi:MAG: RNA polymerase sigma factor, partial [Candidatus Competibacterales bacterium]|nr:RNA polymerase sigma factor [Candidatus Competibacterales bacterium]